MQLYRRRYRRARQIAQLAAQAKVRIIWFKKFDMQYLKKFIGGIF